MKLIGLGGQAAGDDGVGLAVIDALGARELPPGVELCRAHDASALVSLLDTVDPVVVVDAVVDGATPGTVRVFDEEAVSAANPLSVSTHGLGVRQAIALARALGSGGATPRVWFVTVAIEAPRTPGLGLSDAVGRAVRVAADRVLEIARATNGADAWEG